MKLLLVRHPKPDVKAGLCYGDMDVPLVKGWQTHAQALKASLNLEYDNDKTRCYHSPLSRAALLANHISDGLSQPVDALREMDFGHWEGLCWSNIPRQEMDVWASDIVNENPFQGETLQAVADRVWQWWLSVKDEPMDTCVLVAHSGVIKVLVSLLCGWPLSKCFRIDVDFTSVSEFSIQGEWVSLKRLGAGDWFLNTPEQANES